MAKGNTKKNKSNAEKNGPKKPLIKKIFYAVAVTSLIAVVYMFLTTSPYFKLRDIEIIDKSGATELSAGGLLATYKGRNIFGINIHSISSQIKIDTPSIKDAIVRRALPNKLEINIIPRIPVAKIKGARYFPIDRTGMVLSPDIETGRLPVIMGLSMWVRPKVGAEIKNAQIQNAFLLIDALDESSSVSDYTVSTIDVSNHKNLSFYLVNGVEIKIGNEDFLERLGRLNTTLSKPGLDKENIRYIDLRFKDVVIGPK
jgi:cell division protein FtsQ